MYLKISLAVKIGYRIGICGHCGKNEARASGDANKESFDTQCFISIDK